MTAMDERGRDDAAGNDREEREATASTSLSTASMTLGIAAAVVLLEGNLWLASLCALLALLFVPSAFRHNPHGVPGRGMAIAGLVLGVVVLGCVLMLLVSVANAGSLAYEMARWEMGWMR